MYRCKDTHDSPYHLTKLAIYSFLRPEAVSMSKYGQISYEMVYFDDIVHFIDEDNNVTFVDFDCGSTFNIEAATKVRQTFPDPVKSEEFKCIPNNDQYNRFF